MQESRLWPSRNFNCRRRETRLTRIRRGRRSSAHRRHPPRRSPDRSRTKKRRRQRCRRLGRRSRSRSRNSQRSRSRRSRRSRTSRRRCRRSQDNPYRNTSSCNYRFPHSHTSTTGTANRSCSRTCPRSNCSGDSRASSRGLWRQTQRLRRPRVWLWVAVAQRSRRRHRALSHLSREGSPLERDLGGRSLALLPISPCARYKHPGSSRGR